MSNIPSIFAPPPGQGGSSSSNNTPGQSQGYQASNTYTPSAAAMGSSSSYTPSAAAMGSSSYTPSAAAMGTSSSYTPSAAAMGTTSSYTPSAAAMGSSSYTPSTSSYTPSAAAMGTSSSYTPSAAATGATSSYTPSAAGMGQPTNVRSGNSPPPFSQALTAPPPQYSSAPAATATAATTMTKRDEYKPTVAAYGNTSAAPYAVATPTVPYQHGNGPTHGVVVQSNNPVQCHKVAYEIKGQEMQLVEIHLEPQATVIAEAGAMMYLEEDVDFKTKFGDGSEPKQGFFKKIMAAGGRLMTGESLFITHFTNQGSMPRIAAFAAPYPGTILPIDLMELQRKYPNPDPSKQTSLICQRDAFLCAAKGTKLSMHFHKKIGAGLFGGEGFILQKLQGDGMAFCHAGGCVIKRELKPGERLRVDTGCLVGFTSPGINYDITMAPGLKTMFFGGEGVFLATLQGEGTVWLQSLPFARLANRVLAAQGSTQGEGSRLTGGFGDLIDGDGFGKFRL